MIGVAVSLICLPSIEFILSTVKCMKNDYPGLSTKNHYLIRQSRSGASAVEFSIIAPLLFVMVFGCVEFSRAFMATQSLEEAARSGCRVAVLRGATTNEIDTEVRRILAPVSICTYTMQIQPASIAMAERWTPVTVTITASFADLAWLPMPRFLGGKTYTSSCTLPKEYSSGS